jgi:serine/threonine protein kinase/tetratricopeptide (TPR) repeat protein
MPLTVGGKTRFRLVRKLGEGGMGVVYEAFDADRSMAVALKTLSYVNPSALYLFKQEFRSIADVTHPNLISLYELFADAEEWFFTMQLLHGVRLLDYLREGCSAATFEPTATVSSLDATTASTAFAETRTLPAEGISGPTPAEETVFRRLLAKGASPDSNRVRKTLVQVANGVAALHAAGKLHRDIKPSNVLVDAEGHATVLDFGLAIDVASAARPGKSDTVGTLAYMSPEQGLGSPVSPASDWYSLGVVLYQVLCGELPFRGSARDVLSGKLSGRCPRPGAIATKVDPQLEELALGLLDPDPARRPNESDVLAALAGSTSVPISLPSTRDVSVLFYGREKEQKQLRAALDASVGGSVAAALVHGASGVGKSSLVQHYLESTSALVLRGRCYEQESVPYKAFDSAVDALCEHLLTIKKADLQTLLPPDMDRLAQLFPVLNRVGERVPFHSRAESSSDPRRARRRAVAAIRELLRKLRSQRPIILVIDDLQWGDVDSVLLLNEIFSPPQPPPILLICTYRREYADRSPCLAALFEMRGTNASVQWFDVPVDPFPPEDCRELAMQVLGSAPEASAIADKIAQESAGNPYFALELARYTTRMPYTGQAAPDLQQLLQRRIADLPAESRWLLEVIAVHGQPLSQVDAYRAASLTTRDPAMLTTLRAANLVRSSGTGEEDELEPFHDRVREAALEAIPSEMLRERHNSLAQTLEVSGRGQPESLGFHFEHAGVIDKAGRYYEMAGDRATTTLAFDRATSHYRHSMELLKLTPIQEASLRAKLADALVNSGRSVEAASEFERAAEAGPPEKKLELQRRAGFHYAASGRVDRSYEVFGRVLGSVGLRLPSSPRAMLLSLLWNSLRLRMSGTSFRQRGRISRSLLERFDAIWSIAAPLGMISTAQAMSLGMQSLRLALKAGDPERLVYGLQVAAYGLALEGESGRSRARSLIKVAHDIVEQRQDQRLRGTLLFTEAAVEYVRGEWLTCIDLLDKAEEIFLRVPGAHWEIASTRTLQLYSLHVLGKFTEVQARSSPFLQEAEELGDLYSCANVETFCAPMALVILDDQPDRALQCIKSGLQRWTVKGYHLQNAMAAHATSWLAFYEGRAACNLHYVEKQWRQLQAAYFDRLENIRTAWQDLRLRTALAAKASPAMPPADRTRASKIAEAARKALAREQTKWGRATSNVAEAAMAESNGNILAAFEKLLEAAHQFEAMGMMAYASSARRRAGQLVRSEKGEEIVRTADAWFGSQSVARPDRVAAMHVGGFSDLDRKEERVQ